MLHAAAPFGLGAQALGVARRHGIPSVAIFQTDVARYASSYGLRLSTRAAWRWVRTVHAMADLTLAPSSSAVADLRRIGVPRVGTWGRGVDTATYHPNRRRTARVRQLRARLAPDGRVLSGYVGRLAPEKKVQHLAAVSAVASTRLVLIGDGPERESLEQRLTGTDAVFLGAQYGDDLADAYAVLDLFVHTGTQETFGQTLQEAMAAGLPVLAPAVGGPLDIVQHGETGLLLPPHDESALSAATAELIRDPGLRARMGEAGRRAVLPRSWTALCDDLVEHYHRVIGERAAVLV